MRVGSPACDSDQNQRPHEEYGPGTHGCAFYADAVSRQAHVFMPKLHDPEHAPSTHAEHNCRSGIPVMDKLPREDEQISRRNDRARQDADQGDRPYADQCDSPVRTHVRTLPGRTRE